MKHQWVKLGRLYTPPEQALHPKLISHAANPLPVLLEDDIYRVFFSGRDANKRSSVGAVDIDIVKRKIVAEHSKPFFEHGPPGSYFADGVSIGNCYVSGGVTYMLFMGWQNPKGGHWRGDIGRLRLSRRLELELDSEQAFVGSDSVDPISLSYPWVLPNPVGGFDMWYGSTLAWDAGNGEMLHVIQHASSPDGHHWNRDGLAVPYEIGLAQAFSRPTVAYNPDGSRDMWFSYRGGPGKTYRIGYAHSSHGQPWRLDVTNAGIGVSVSGWDSEMIEYPYVWDHKGERYMLYNGNAYGATGFGLAVLGER